MTLTVSGEDEYAEEGADVFVNGKWVGTLQKTGGQLPQFSLKVPTGTLTVEVKKEGYLPFLKVITSPAKIKEQLISVRLTPETTIQKDKEKDKHDETTEPPQRSLNKTENKLPVCPD